MKRKKLDLRTLLVLLIAFVIVGCDDFLEQLPPKEANAFLPSEAVESPEDLQELLNSAYDVLANTYNGNAQNLATLLGDHMARPVNQNDLTEVWLRNTTIFNGTIGNTFRDWHIAILRSNTVLLNLDRIELSADERDRFEGEARFIRALCHFDVVRLFAQPYDWTPGNTHPGIAIRTTTDVSNIARSSVGEVYNFILSDIAFAKENLPEINPGGGDPYVYATRMSAIGLEALVRFQMHQYQEAYDLSSTVINSGSHPFDPTLVNKYVFPNPSSEYIFYVYSAPQGGGAVDDRNGAFQGNYNSDGNFPSLQINSGFYEDVTAGGGPRSELFTEIEQDDNFFYATSMFNENFFHIPIITTTQLLLVRAESAVRINQNLPQAIEDINRVRERAYGNSAFNLIPSSSPENVLEAARNEMHFEFPFNGQRTHDLKRRGSEGEDIIVRGVPYDCPGMIIQFPATESTDLFQLNPGGGC